MNPILFKKQGVQFFYVGHHQPLGLFDRLKRQALGLLSLLAGLFLSIPGIPGPGFIFVALALLLMEFPGKKGLIQWMQPKRWFRITRILIRKKMNILLVLPKRPGTLQPTNP